MFSIERKYQITARNKEVKNACMSHLSNKKLQNSGLSRHRIILFCG